MQSIRDFFFKRRNLTQGSASSALSKQNHPIAQNVTKVSPPPRILITYIHQNQDGPPPIRWGDPSPCKPEDETEENHDAPSQPFLKISVLNKEALRDYDENSAPKWLRVKSLENLIHQFDPYLHYVRCDNPASYELMKTPYDDLIRSSEDLSRRIDNLLNSEECLKDGSNDVLNINQELKEKLDNFDPEIDNLRRNICAFDRVLCEASITSLVLFRPQLDRELSEVVHNIDTIIKSNMHTLKNLKKYLNKMSDSLMGGYKKLISRMNDELICFDLIKKNLNLVVQMFEFKKEANVSIAIRELWYFCDEYKKLFYNVLDEEKKLKGEIHEFSKRLHCSPFLQTIPYQLACHTIANRILCV